MKRENINLILMIVLIIIPIILISVLMRSLTTGTGEIIAKITGSTAGSEADVITGVFLVPLAGAGILATVALWFLRGILVIVSIISLIFLIVARVQINNKEKKVTYRVLMTLVYIPYTLLVLLLFGSLLAKFTLFKLILVIIGTVCLVVNYCFTYSKKTFEVEGAVETVEETNEGPTEENHEETVLEENKEEEK